MSTKSFKISLLKILILSLFLTLSFSYACKKYVYSHYVLALEWPPQYCAQNTCKPNWSTLVNKNQFTIHGFWPATSDLDYINCIQYFGHDPSCYVDYKYNQTKFNSTTLNNLNIYWSQFGAMNDFRDYQWKKHGTCYMSIVKTSYQANFINDDQIFVEYFADTLSRVQSWVNINMTKFQFKTKGELATALNLYQDQFYVTCEDQVNSISEVHVCFNLAAPGTQVTMDCPPNGPKQCVFPAVLRKSFQNLIKLGFLLIIFSFAMIF